MKSFIRALARSSRRKIGFTVSFVLVFVLSDILAQLVSSVPVSWGNVQVWRIMLALSGALLFIWLILSVQDWQNDRQKQSNDSVCIDTSSVKATPSLVVKAGTWILLLAWLLMYAHYWPLASMSDIPSEIISPLLLSGQHPLIYSWIVSGFATGSQAWFGTMLPGIVLLSLLQIIAWVAACRYLLGTLQKLGVHQLALWLLVAYLAIFPLVGNYSFAIVKDGLFGIFVILLVPLLLRIWQTRGAILHQTGFLAALAGTCIGFSVTRNNGLVVALVILVLVAIIYRRYWQIILPLTAVIMTISLIPSAISAHFVGGQKFVETVGVPLQMVGYTVTYNSTCLSEDAQKYFGTLIDLDEWAKIYDPETVDTLKDSSAFDAGKLQETRLEFLGYFVSALTTCPSEMLSGFLAHTDHLWRIDSAVSGTHAQSYFAEAVTNYPANRQMWIDWWAEHGISNQSLLPDFLQNTLGKWYDWGVRNTPGPGTWFWLGALLACGFIYRKRSEYLPIVIPILLLWLTLIVAAPTTHPFRYIEPIIIIIPVLAATLFGGSVTRDKPNKPRYSQISEVTGENQWNRRGK